MSPSAPAADRHPMRLVILRTGLTADLLRAWEKRYGAVTPMRSHGGQRLYSDGAAASYAEALAAVGAARFGSIRELRSWLQGVSETR